MFTYSGWNAATYVAEEVRDPGKNVAKALAIGTLAVTAIYVFLNVLYIYVIPIDELAKVKGSVLDIVADRLLGTAAGNIMGVVSIIGLLAGISGNTFAGPRVYYAMARDGVFFARAAAIHPTYRTPGERDRGAGHLVNAAGALRRRQHAHDLHRIHRRALRRCGGDRRCSCCAAASRTRRARSRRSAIRLRPAIFAVVSLLIVLNALWTDLVTPITSGTPFGPSAAGLLVIALGLPLYWWFSRKHQA